jgi:serine/threonine protein kinase
MPTTLDGDRGSADQAPEVIRLPTRSNEDPFTDEDIRYVSENLSRAGQRTWSKLPRIYVVLRRTNLISSIKAFIEQDITDLAFPFSNRTLPHALSDQDARQRFLDAQHIVLSKVLELERGSKHYHFSRASDVPLVKLSELGKGGFGSVDRVRSEISFREYARKLIPRGPTFRKDRKILKDFENELNNLRKLSHQHIVQLVGSYTDPQFVGIIMYPVAEYNLKEYLAGPFVPSLVQTFFGCLATAVRFLHENRVRHKDIKPQNVLVNRGSVLLTDFGISRDWTEAGHSTTSGPSVRSIRYCAPEVADSEPRNSSSDIWSLGCVFLEMWTVLSGHSIDSLAKYLQKNGTLSDYYQLNPTGITSWCGSVLSVNSSLSGPLFWIQNMLVMEREDRWTIQMVSDEIQEYSETSVVRFVGHCCDVNIGSPETVDSTLDYVRDSTTATTVEDSRPSRASTSESTPITSLDSGGAVLAATSRVNDSTSSSSIPNSPFASLQINTSGEMSKKRSGSEIGVEASTQPAKRHQPHLDRRPSQSPGLTTAEALNSTERRLPKSFLAANSNRFSREQVLDLLNASNPLQERTSRSTRGLRSSEKAVFTYGDHMLPTALYEGTCVRSKPSQYARWTTLKGLVEHMMPATLRGYVRLCPDASEGLASIPTVRATGSPSDEVHGMIIFCWHDSHTSGSRKYESKNEHDVQEAVFLELKDGSEMDVEATIRVWNDDVADALVPYNGNWQPINLLEGEWYSLTPASVLAEDANIQLSPTDEDNNTMDSFQMENSETVGQAIGIDVQPVPQPVGLGVASVYSNEPVKLTNSLVSGLFYQQVRS